MKMKISIFISIITSIILAFSLTACDDNGNSGGGGLPMTIEKATEKIQDMPTSTDDRVIESAIGEVFGADINLPEGTYSAQVYSVSGASAYMVTVSEANTTATDYYKAIKAEMLSEGYVADEDGLAFYKMVGNVVYSAVVENDGSDVVIIFSASSPTATIGDETPGGTTPGGTVPGGVAPEETLPEGDLDAFPVAIINEMFSELGVTIPNCTSGSSYSIDLRYDNTETGVVSITVTCYGMTADEREAYKQALKDAGFKSQYYLVYSHSNRFYSELVASSTFNDRKQTYSITFTTTYEEPAYVLPQNVKITYKKDNIYFYTAIKIGNDYYMKEEQSYDGIQMNLYEEVYYKWTNEGWELWENYGEGWEKSNYGNETEIDFVEATIFDFIVESEIDEEAVQGDNSTVLGKTVEVWDIDEGYGITLKLYKDVETGIILKYEYNMSGFAMVYVVTSIDTTITSFGDVELPQ